MENYVATPKMGFVDAVKACIAKYKDVNGRARRSEFFFWNLFALLLVTVTFKMGAVAIIVAIVLAVPGYSVLVRRLHDVGQKSILAIIYYVVYVVCQFLNYKVLQYVDAVENRHVIQFQLKPYVDWYVYLITALAILSLVILFFVVKDSQKGPNQYGESPKYKQA